MKNNLSKDNIHLIFNQIASTYDLINTILSLGIDRIWRKKLCNQIPEGIPLNILDLATGTGDQAFEILKKRPLVSITGADKAQKMLDLAKEKVQKKISGPIHFLQADAACLPFEPAIFDFVTLSFGIRNFSNLESSICEIQRVLKKGGTLLILEFGIPNNRLIRFFYFFYLRKVLPKIGSLLSSHHQAYKYLNESIEDFPSGNKLCHVIQNQGFEQVSYICLTFGIVNLYIGKKNYD